MKRLLRMLRIVAPFLGMVALAYLAVYAYYGTVDGHEWKADLLVFAVAFGLWLGKELRR